MASSFDQEAFLRQARAAAVGAGDLDEQQSTGKLNRLRRGGVSSLAFAPAAGAVPASSGAASAGFGSGGGLSGGFDHGFVRARAPAHSLSTRPTAPHPTPPKSPPTSPSLPPSASGRQR